MANEDRLPQFDRAKIKTPIGFFSTLFRLMRISEEFAIPAIVKEYDRNTGIVKVQPLVSNLADDINNKEVEIPRSEYEVHVVRFAHGGYVVDAPLFVGDTGWLIAGDRNSTSAIKANSTILKEDQTDENSPNEGYKKPDDNSLKSFAWGFFIPDTWGVTDFTEEDGLVVRGQRISVESDHVTVECGDNSASISKESVNIDTEKCSIEIKENYASVISGKYGAKIDENSAIVEGPNDKISIDDNGLHHEGTIDEKRDIISAIEYDEEKGDIIKKSFSVSKRGDLIVDIDEETDWECLGLPNPTSANDGKLTIKQGDNTLGEFTANQADNTTVTIPEPPIVNDGTLTIKQGNVTLGTFTANQANDLPVTVIIPEPPTPPTVNDGTLTIKQGTTTLGTFTANQPDNTPVTVIIPEPPTPPTVNDGTLTIKQGTTTLGTFTANQATPATVTIPEPPTPPTVNNGTLTIKQGNTTLGTFTANQPDNTPVTVIIPEPLTPPTVNDGTLTLTFGSQTKTFSANQQDDVTLSVPAKRLIAGTNVAIGVNGNDITISSGGGGGATSGYTGSRSVVAAVKYDLYDQQLQVQYWQETWSNGVMTGCTNDGSWHLITGGQAVEET